jgi:prophage DNA circulation protein
VVFHDQLRKLWEDHVTWTRMAIVTFAAGSNGFDASAQRLLANQVDIGDAIAPFYGDAAGAQLSALLHDHITIAVELLQAAKVSDTTAFTDAQTRWYANSNQIADFLAAANPRSWPADVTRAMMKEHLDQTLAEAADELHGNYTASVADYDAIHQHVLEMADLLSSGIMRQFPRKFH